jgi:hypothetical protein
MRCHVALAVLALTGCAHARFDAAANRVCDGKVCYRVGELGPGWRLVHQEGAAVGFFNQDVGAVVEANATCRDDAEAAPLATLTRHLFIGYTDRRIESQDRVQLARRAALHTRATARLDGVPMALDLYVLKRNGCIFDLSYAAPPATAARGVVDFRRFVGGFVDERRLAAAPREGG